MDRSSFEECFRRDFPRLVALGESMTGDRALAHDCAQEAFVRLHDRWDDVSTYDRPLAWLRRVMTNLVIDQIRSSRAERRAVDRLGSRSSPPSTPPHGTVADDWSELIGALPPRQRAIVSLFYGADLSIDQVAETLELSPNSVKSALSKARTTLRAGLERSHAQ